MLQVYVRGADGRIGMAQEPRAALASGAFVWADLYAAASSPETADAERLIEETIGVDAPTPQERAAMEDSARFYEDNGAVIMTATLMGQRGEGAFVTDAVTFILAQGKLITVRAIKPRAFSVGSSRASARLDAVADGGGVFIALLESTIERIADILQEIAAEANTLSGSVFVSQGEIGRDVLRAIGRMGTMVSLSHASLSSLNRLLAFAHSVCPRYGMAPERFSAFERDVVELERSAEALQVHLSFLLDAGLGLVAAEQNNVLKALSVATIAFIPPTLVASIFGMNFVALPWIHEPWGPWAGFALMVATPLALFVMAKSRRWF